MKIDKLQKATHALALGPFVEDWEFETIVGATRNEVFNLGGKEIAALSVSDMQICKNVANTLHGYPHGKENALQTQYGLRKEDLVSLIAQIQTLERGGVA